MNPRTIVMLIAVVIDLGLLLYAIFQYTKLKTPTLRYLIVAILCLFFGDLLVVGVGITEYRTLAAGLGDLFGSLAFSTLGMFFLLVFLRSFSLDHPITGLYRWILNAFLIIFTGGLTVTLLIWHYDALFFEGIVADISFLSGFEYSGDGDALLIVYSIFSYACSILTVIEFGLVGRLIFRRYKEARSRRVNITLRNMALSFAILITGAILDLLIGAVGNLIFIIGYYGIFLIYLANGIFLLQAETLRRLIIIDDQGTPRFQHVFRQFEDRKAMPGEDVLFSGALKAVSSLVSSLTGGDEMLKEIILDDAIFLTARAGSYNIVVIADHPSEFFRSALSTFSIDIKELTKRFQPHQYVSDEVAGMLEEAIAKNFGKIHGEIETGSRNHEQTTTA